MQNRGITLVELLIALAVLGVAFGALAYSQVTSYRATARAGLVSQVRDAATQILENQVEAVLADFPGYYYRCLTGSETGCHGPGFLIKSGFGLDGGSVESEGYVLIQASATRQDITVTLTKIVSCYDRLPSRGGTVDVLWDDKYGSPICPGPSSDDQ